MTTTPGRSCEPNDLVLYVESRRAVVCGDTLIDRGNGLEVHPEWPVEAFTSEDVVQRLRPLLDLPVDVVLPTHADPADRAALERALSLYILSPPISALRSQVVRGRFKLR